VKSAGSNVLRHEGDQLAIIGQVDVGKHAHLPPRREHAGPDRSAFSQVAGMAEQADARKIGERRSRKVVVAIIHDENFPLRHESGEVG